MLRKAVWRFLGRAGLKSLLFLVIVLHVAIFVAVNFYSIPDNHEAGGNPLVFTALKGNESEVIHRLLTSGVVKQTSFLPTTPTVPLTQHIIDSIAQNMEVRFQILQSFNSAVITLINKGSALIGGNLWAIYMCLATGLELGHLVHREDGYVLPDKKSIKLTHLSGCSFKIEPTKDFKAIPPGKSIEIMVHIGLTESRSDLAPRWYVAADGLEPRIIPNTASEELDFVFFPPKRRKSWDSFVNCDAADLGSAPLLVIPTPSEVFGFNATNKLSVDGNWIVFGEPGLEDETSFLAGKLNIPKSFSQSTRDKVIKLKLGRVSVQGTEISSSESYLIQVNTSDLSIVITGTGNAGVFYGVQTLLALVTKEGQVPEVQIRDSPRFSYRGLMVDIARNFQPKNEILKLLDVMAMYKMNKLHFHLTDNEAWRLEMPGIEELTSVGARRCHDLQEKTCIFSHLGSGPDTSTSGTGFYSTEDYREILRHAKRRHIQVIPEFDLPGHSHAAIKSMIARHDRLVKEGKEPEAKEFLLSDFKDESQYFSVQFFTDDTANSCLRSTYRFIERVLRELTNLHHDIQPLTVFHFGGDEVPEGAWRKSPACEKIAKILNFTYKSVQTHQKLKEYFLTQISNITAEMNLALAGWGDFLFEKSRRTLIPRDFFSNKEIYSFSWSVTGAVKNLKEVSLMANHGYKVVLSSPDYIYLDHPYEPHPEERGKHWATPYTDTRKIFGFAPVDLYKDITCNFSNCSHAQQNVVGIESALWSETVRTAEQMYTMLFPRLLAVAERAWHKASWEEVTDRLARERQRTGDWERFANTITYRELGRLDEMGVPYRVPPPAARITGRKLEVRTALPGLKVEFSRDDGETWNDVTSGGIEVDGILKLRTR
ncbi:unnamed protein product [Porites lobata]|uniref:beta-N-acetylhexosaminidase n=1 Tax=Porites lobata TaxID=104759 RepID=A0ABN8NUZ0_9CNID|nr:unnamed protein product [Porites lobata]